MLEDVFIISARRTPVVPMGGAFSKLSFWEFADPVINDCLSASSLSGSDIDEVYIGNALSGGGNPARVISLAAGLPERMPSQTIDTQCCSGLDAIISGIKSIKSGAAHIVLAGGVESYSRSPLRFERPIHKDSEPVQYARPPFSPWPDRDPEMAEAAHKLAKQFSITREFQSQWAIESHRKAILAQKNGVYRKELSLIQNIDVKNDTFARNLTLSICRRAKVLAGSDGMAIDSATAAVSANAAAIVLLV